MGGLIFRAISILDLDEKPRLRRWSTASGAFGRCWQRVNASEPTKLLANDARMTIRRRLMYRMPFAGAAESRGAFSGLAATTPPSSRERLTGRRF